MDARTYFLTYVERVGGRKAAAEKLGLPYVTIASVCNGHRGIGKRLAERMQINSGGFLWIVDTGISHDRGAFFAGFFVAGE